MISIYLCFFNLRFFPFQIPANVEYHSKQIVYSRKRNLFLVVYEFSGATNEVVLYWENTGSQLPNSKGSTAKGLSDYGIPLLSVEN